MWVQITPQDSTTRSAFTLADCSRSRSMRLMMASVAIISFLRFRASRPADLVATRFRPSPCYRARRRPSLVVGLEVTLLQWTRRPFTPAPPAPGTCAAPAAPAVVEGGE